jgi:hypothetical protein
MPLYFAAQWIATRGGAVEFEPTDLSVWQEAFAQLLARIASDEVAVTGMCGGERERLPGHLFASVRVDYPFSDATFELLFSEELYLSSCPYLDEEHWHQGFDDNLQTRWGVKWSKLMVLKSDVAERWRFEAPGDAVIVHSGAPGRPSSMHLVKAEYQVRSNRGELRGRIGQVAEELSEWLASAHPDAPQLTPKTIANELRSEHRQRLGKA